MESGIHNTRQMEQMYELILEGDERLVATEEPVEVGDALIVDDEILLVLREVERSSTIGRARYECRRALHLAHRAQELVAYAKELELKFAEAREVRASRDRSRTAPIQWDYSDLTARE